MNRRKFLSLLPKVAGALGIAAMVGLPEVLENVSTNSLGFKIPPGFPDDVYPLRLSNNENIIVDYDGTTWGAISLSEDYGDIQAVQYSDPNTI